MKTKQQPPTVQAKQPISRSERFRIARQGTSEQYSMQYYAEDRHWATSVRGLNYKQAQQQLERLRQLGCGVMEQIVTI